MVAELPTGLPPFSLIGSAQLTVANGKRRNTLVPMSHTPFLMPQGRVTKQSVGTVVAHGLTVSAGWCRPITAPSGPQVPVGGDATCSWPWLAAGKLRPLPVGMRCWCVLSLARSLHAVKVHPLRRFVLLSEYAGNHVSSRGAMWLRFILPYVYALRSPCTCVRWGLWAVQPTGVGSRRFMWCVRDAPLAAVATGRGLAMRQAIGPGAVWGSSCSRILPCSRTLPLSLGQ